MYCSKCGLTVIVLSDARVVKACECNAPIIAEMKATVIQNSNLE